MGRPNVVGRPSGAEMSRVVAVVLAGGAGTRMGGADKGLLPFRGRPLVAHVLDRVAPQVDSVLVSANRHLDTYRTFGCPVVTDLPAGDPFAGPLAGIQAAWHATDAPLLLCVPCDVPHLPVDLRLRLQAALGAAPIAVASCAGRWEPTICLMRRESLPALDAFLAAGGRKVREWQAGIGAVACEFPDASPFANCNTPEDLAGAVR